MNDSNSLDDAMQARDWDDPVFDKGDPTQWVSRRSFTLNTGETATTEISVREIFRDAVKWLGGVRIAPEDANEYADQATNLVIDILAERAGKSVMSDGTGDRTTCLVADWLREQKVGE
jgi:hypothetical protein